jgi:hypothetical protein
MNCGRSSPLSKPDSRRRHDYDDGMAYRTKQILIWASAAALIVLLMQFIIFKDVMITLRLVLMLLALICFALAAVGISTPRVNLLALGLALWLLAIIAA